MQFQELNILVIHYVGALGGAKVNCEYYAGASRGASAYYFVDFGGEIYQSVEDANIAWHCGVTSYKPQIAETQIVLVLKCA